jgi:hypothetical protein
MIQVSDTRNLTVEHVEHWKYCLENDIKLVQFAIKNKSISLEERWKMYLIVRPYLETKGIYMDFETLENVREVSWYDDFYLDRHAVMELDEDFLERAAEKFELNQQQLDALAEEILESGYGSFKNDW